MGGRESVSGADESMLVARPPLQRVQCLARAGRSPRGRGRGRVGRRPTLHPARRLPFGRGSTAFCFPSWKKKINASMFAPPLLQ